MGGNDIGYTRLIQSECISEYFLGNFLLDHNGSKYGDILVGFMKSLSDDKISDKKTREEREEKYDKIASDAVGYDYLNADHAGLIGNDKESNVLIYYCTVEGCKITKHTTEIIEPPPHCVNHKDVEMKLK